MLPTRLLALSTTIAVGALAGAASAASTAPMIVAGNPTCADLDPSWTELKYDGGTAGAHNVSGGTVSGTITIDPGSLTASFTANGPIDAVIIKAADRANVYTYDPDVTSDSGLDTGGKYQISHVSLCYGPEPATPGQPAPEPKSEPVPQPQPQQQVLGEVAKGGSMTAVKPALVVAGTSTIHGPSSCVNKPFTVRITGRRIAKVTFRVDGRSVKSSGRKVRIDPRRYGAGLHRVQARVRYAASSLTKPRTHRFVFQRCAQQAVQPSFAG